GFALVCRITRIRRTDRGGHPRAASPGEGDVLRAGLRVERVRVSCPAEDLYRGGEGPDGPILRPIRRGARLPDGCCRPGPQGRLHLDSIGSAALPARAG